MLRPQRAQFPRIVAPTAAHRGGHDRFERAQGKGGQRARHRDVGARHQRRMKGVRDRQWPGCDTFTLAPLTKPFQRVQTSTGYHLRRMVDAAKPHPVDVAGESVKRRLTRVDRQHPTRPRGVSIGHGRSPRRQETECVGRVEGACGHRCRDLSRTVTDADIRSHPALCQQPGDADPQGAEHGLADLRRGQGRLGRRRVRVGTPHQFDQRTSEHRARDAVQRVNLPGETGEPLTQVGEHARTLDSLPGKQPRDPAVRLGQWGSHHVTTAGQRAEATGAQSCRSVGEPLNQLCTGRRDHAEAGGQRLAGGQGVGDRCRGEPRVGVHGVPDRLGMSGEQLR